MKKIISIIFDITFINFHFKKNYSVEEAKKTAFNNISGLFSLVFFALFVMIFVVIFAGLFQLKMTRSFFYILLLPAGFFLYFKKKIIQEYIIKPNIDFSMDKYSTEYINKNNERGLFFILGFGLFGGLIYVIMRLVSWTLYHL